MIGHTSAELSNFCSKLPPGEYGTPEQYEKYISSSLSEMKVILNNENEFNTFIDKVLKAFPSTSCSNTPEFACCRLLDNLVNDFFVRCPQKRMARALRTVDNQPDIFFFNFDQPISCPDLTSLGAFHTSDLTWVFGAEGSYYESKSVPNCTWTESEKDFSSKVITRWINFATNSSPSAFEWLPYDRPHYYYQNLAAATGFYQGEDVRSNVWCSFWDEIDNYYGQKFFPDDNPPHPTTESSPTDQTRTFTDIDPIIPPGNVAMTTWIFFLAMGTIFFFGCACAWCIAGIVGCCGRKVDIEYKLVNDDSDDDEI